MRTGMQNRENGALQRDNFGMVGLQLWGTAEAYMEKAAEPQGFLTFFTN